MVQTTAANQPSTSINNNLINFNPTVKFDGNDALASKSLFGAATASGATILTVSTQNASVNTAFFSENVSGGTFDLIANWAADNNIYWDPPYASNRLNYNVGNINGQNILWSCYSNPLAAAGNRQFIYRNGQSLGTGGSGAGALTGNNSPFYLGGNSNGGGYNGRTGEVIIYSGPVPAADLQKIHSYLSVKWGISLDQTVATNYYASDWNGTTGTTLWNASANSAYKYRVTGIGRDDCSDLTQIQSRNNDTTNKGYVTMGRGSISSSNPGNPNTFAVDRSYLLWGDDNGSGIASSGITGDGTISIATASCVNTRRLQKVFKVAVTNAPGTVQVQFNVAGLALGKSASDFYLAINSTSSFAGPTVTKLVAATSYQNSVVTFDNVSFTDGQFFTLVGQKSGAPANVSAGITTWLKAEDGITLNGGTVSLWEDQSAGGRNAAQATAGNQPIYVAQSLNFNPALNFDNGNKVLQFSSAVPNTNLRYFAVGRPGTSGAYTLFRGGVQDHHLYMDGSFNAGYYDNTPATYKTSGIITNNTRHWLYSFAHDDAANTAILKVNAKAGTTLTGIDETNADISYLGNCGICANQNFGLVSEVIAYNNGSLSAGSELKIQSYLALKYGVTLDQTTPTGYLASDSTVIWNATANATYKNRITGIGRDDCSDLEQDQSRNVDTLQPGWAMIARGDLYPANIDNPNKFTQDKSFVLFGDDSLSGISAVAITGDGITTLPQGGTCTQFRRLAKTFKVSSFVNGSAAANSGLQISINTRTLNFGGSTAGIYLAINSSSNFAGTVTQLVPAGAFANDIYTFDDVTLNHGDYFTLIGSAASGPGNVISGLDIWVRADAGVTLNGTTVSNWGDQGANGNDLTQATAANQPTYVTASNNNFNPSLSFNGSTSVLNMPFTILKGKLETAHSIFGVINSTTAVDQPWLNIWNGSANADAVWNTGGQIAMDLQPAGSAQPGAAGAGVVVGMPVINGTTYSGDGVVGGFTAYRNGRISGNNASNNIADGTINFAQLGKYISNASVNAQIPEFIVFNRQLAAFEKAKVESYLSIKYGVSLDQTTAQNYYASDWNGTTGTVLWNGTTNTTYKYRVTGIGRDDCSNLSQKQSRNSDTTASVNLVIGSTDIATTNAANTNNFSADKSFDLWGDDNAATSFATTLTGAPNGLNARMTRVWKVQENGTVGVVRIAIPANRVANPSKASLIVNNGSATFNGSSTYYPLAATTINGVSYYYADADLSDNDYFTFGSDIKAPGGVAGTTVWMRPDYGTSANIDGGVMSDWLDYAANLKHATQTTVAYQPTYLQNATDNVNFNPVVKFDGTDDRMQFEDQLGLTGTNNFTFASVSRPTTFADYRALLAPSASTGMLIAHRATNAVGVVHAYSVADISTSTTGSVAGAVTPLMVTRNASTFNWYRGMKADGTVANAYSFGSGQTQYLGGGYTNGASNLFIGTMGDVIVYPFALNSQQRQRVETYLAIKYGYTIDQTTPTDYLATDGTTKVWDNTVGGVYNNNIAGIARDDAEGLNQIQSKSINSGVQVSIANLSFADDNLNNGNAFGADISYLTWGDDAGATTYLTAVSGAPVNTRMTRLWKAQKTGTVGSVQVAIPYNAVANPSATYLVRSSDATIDGTDNYVKMDSIRINGALYYAANTTFATGEFFTFGSSLKLPGGVTGVSLWLRPDYGVNTTTDNTPASEWLDGAGYVNHALQATANIQPSFRNNTTDNVNFNAMMRFDGTTDYMDLDVTRLPTSTTARSLFMTGKTALVDGAYHYGVAWGNYANGQGSALANGASGLGSFVGFFSNDVPSATGFWQVGVPNALSATWAGAGGNASLFSKNKLIAGPLARTWTTGTNYARIGASNNATPGEFWNGTLGDVIVYPYALNASQRLRVESYLAVKYGYSLDTVAQPNYLASDSTVTWTYNGTYRNRVTGIGRDDLTALDQRQSRNVDTTSPGFVTMGVSSIATLNSENTNVINGDHSFLMWADDGVAGKAITTITGDGVTTLPNSGPCADYVRMAKTYQVQRTNFNQKVQVKVNLNGLTIGKNLNDYFLAIHTSATMTGTISKLVPATSIVNNLLTFDDVDFSAGNYFTVIGQKVQAPASIQSASLKLWLKADDGITLNGTTVQQWDDQSAALNNAVQATAANQPTYNNATTLINFNPAVTFNGTSNRMSLSAPAFGTGSLNYTTFGVVNANTVSGVRYWMSDGTATANLAVGYGHNAATMSSLNWGNPYNAGTVATGITYLESFTRNSTTTVRNNILNGKLAGTVNTGVLNKTNGLASIGSNPSSAEFWSGQIGEVIAYEGVLTAAEQNKINSYLSVKWGVTLAGGDSSYLASDGTVIWNAASNATYKNRITGIGQDLCFDLTQRQSRNQAAGSLLTFGLGTIETTNAANINNFASDKSYVLVGDDNAAAAEQSTDLPSAYVTGTKRLTREWKAAVTGTAPSTLELKFDLSTVSPALPNTLTAADMELIIDNDGDGNFTTGTATIVPATSLASNLVTFDNVGLNTGVVFTVVTKAQKVAAIKLNAKVMLQGAVTGTSMSTDLNSGGFLPVQQPYQAAPFSYVGTEAAASMPSNVTDWVLVELRNPANIGVVLATRAGLLLSDGTITDVDGSSALSFTGSLPGSYYVSVKHRNHLAILSATPVVFDGVTASTFDFTTSLSQASVLSGDPAQMVLKNTKWCMWAGDVNQDNAIDGTDYGAEYNGNVIGNFDVYEKYDLNMDGATDGTDLGILYFINALSPYSTLLNY